MWILYSLLGAFFQATEMAIKKKTLQTKGMNNVIAFLAFSIAAALFAVILFLQDGFFSLPSHLTGAFWVGALSAVFVNCIATFFLYRALDLAELSYLMPYMTLTSLTIIIPPIFLFHEYPSMSGFLGIAIVVLGALLMEYKKATMSELEIIQHKQNRKGLAYFLVTAVCFTISPSVTKLAVIDSSPLFATFTIHLLMGVAFGAIILLTRETAKLKNILQGFKTNTTKKFFVAISLAAISIAISNLSINYAYQFQSVAYVMAIKRVMPLFAFLIGYIYFKERNNLWRKSMATALMILGAIVVTIFG